MAITPLMYPCGSLAQLHPARADGADGHGQNRYVSGVAATMTVVAMGFGYAISIGDPTILSANPHRDARGAA